MKVLWGGGSGHGVRVRRVVVVVVVKMLGITERGRVGNGNERENIPKGNTTQRKLLFNCRTGLGSWISTDFSREL